MRVLCAVTLLAVGACSAPRIDHTRLGSDDLVVMTDRMAASLLASEPVAAADEPWIVTLGRVSNQTNEILPERERRAFIARLRTLLNASDELADRNIRFIMPAEHGGGEARQRQGHDDDRRAIPTHALTATFYAVTQTTRTGRSDAYLCAFQLLDLHDGRLVWEDHYEVKRAVVRSRLD